MTAAHTPDFAIKSPYLFPGESPSEPTRINVAEIAQEVYENYIKPKIPAFGPAAAPPVFSSKNSDNKPFKINLAEGSNEPSWLSRLLQFIKEFIANIVKGAAQKLGMQADFAGGAGAAADGFDKSRDEMGLSGAQNNPAVAEDIIGTAIDGAKEFFADEKFLESLIRLAKTDPQAFEMEMSDVLARLDKKLEFLDGELVADEQKYQEVLNCEENGQSSMGMSALKMDSYLRANAGDAAGNKFIPDPVIAAFRTLMDRQDERSRLVGSVASARHTLGQVAPETFDEVLARYPRLAAASRVAAQDDDKMQAAVRANVAESRVPRACAVGPEVIHAAALPKFGRGRASSAMSMAPPWDDGDLEESDPLEAPIERARVG